MAKPKKNGTASAKTRKTAGALTRKKAVKRTPRVVTRSPQVQPENYGYRISLVRDGANVFINAGCRHFSFDEAKVHWSQRARTSVKDILENEFCCDCSSCTDDARKTRARGRKMVKLLPLLAQRAKRYGWTKVEG